MPRGIFALSSHILHSEYRGPRILNQDGVTPPPATPPATPPAGEGSNPPVNPPANPPKPEDTEGRISQLATENKEMKRRLKEIDDAKKAEDDEKARKKGDFEKLLGDRDATISTLTSEKESVATKLAKYEADAQKRIDDSLKSITDAEKQKSAKAMLEGRPLDEQITLLPEVMKLAGGSAAPSFGGPTPTSTTAPNQTEAAAKQKRFDELLLKQTKDGKLTSQEQQEKEKLANELSSFLKS